MPIYEYLCQECGHKFEVMQRLSDAPQTTCPACSKEALKKLISPVGFQLKGTGWYVTDFRDKGKPKADKDGADKGAGSDAKSETASSKSTDESTSSKSEAATSGNTASTTSAAD